ncbi:CHAT domain-containing protein [Limnoraphis robusta Tam1]|uniref:CHAT domain-containing protein n=1 Tax=Limnoraphis robusta TaxID=1118279 RepID=UPI002B212BA2|nr:CHAT domain-containing protein [Limnoraphis robusta]MEA5497787.1 CHAT domain-containing protein [Limnoraphis robusta BA-68 BA1]MEA5540849.1 CHAT domain-containing protein [Limnoraphis robusta Tam1]
MKKILILSANPADTTRLRLDKEVREIQQTLRQSHHRDEFRVIPVGAVQIDDLQQTLYDYHPTIVHFSGHGSGNNGLILEDNSGRSVLVSEDALARLFKAFQTEVECVLLNACYSEIQAKAIHQHIDCVVGMNQAIGDEAAIKFAVGFYRALGAGEPYDNCFESGRTLIDLNAISEVDKPQIKYRNRTKNLATSSNQESNKTMPSPQEKPQSINKSQSIGDFNFSGSNNYVAPANAGGDVNIDQSQNTQTLGQNPELEAALNELKKLKQEIASTNALNSIQKKQAEFPVEMIETELKKPQPDKSLIDEAVEALKKGLEGVETLAEPVMKVAAILAKVWI